jgi:hypothetical protein
MRQHKNNRFLPIITLVIGLVLFLSYFHLSIPPKEPLPTPAQPSPLALHHPRQTSRVAVIIPYVGSTLPSWFRSFLFTAQLSSDYFDWFIFVTTVMNISTPSNVYLIYVSEDEIADRIVRMDPLPLETEYQLWSSKFLDLLHLFPYMLVEYKPALGWIFEVYNYPKLFSFLPPSLTFHSVIFPLTLIGHLLILIFLLVVCQHSSLMIFFNTMISILLHLEILNECISEDSSQSFRIIIF